MVWIKHVAFLQLVQLVTRKESSLLLYEDYYKAQVNICQPTSTAMASVYRTKNSPHQQNKRFFKRGFSSKNK